MRLQVRKFKKCNFWTPMSSSVWAALKNWYTEQDFEVLGFLLLNFFLSLDWWSFEDKSQLRVDFFSKLSSLTFNKNFKKCLNITLKVNLQCQKSFEFFWIFLYIIQASALFSLTSAIPLELSLCKKGQKKSQPRN